MISTEKCLNCGVTGWNMDDSMLIVFMDEVFCSIECFNDFHGYNKDK